MNTPVSYSENLERPLLNRNFILITLSSFVFFFNFHSFILLPIRIEELGGSVSIIGFIMGMASMATILTTPTVGILVDRWGKKWFLVAGGLVLSFTTIPFAFLDTLNFLFPVLRVFHGAALSLCFVSAGTLVADVSSPSKRSQAIGIFGMFSVINFALAPLIGKQIVMSYGFKEFFILDGIFGLLAFFIAILIKEPKRIALKGLKSSTFISVVFRRGVFITTVVMSVVGAGFVTVITFIPVFAGRIGVESYELFFITYTVSILAVRIFGGWIPDKFGKKRASVPALFLFSLSIIGLAFVSDWTGLVLAGIFFGLGHGLFYPALYALVIDLSPEIDRGKAVSICSVSFTFGGMVGVFTYGVVAQNWGFPLMFEITGAVCFIGFLIFAFLGIDSNSDTFEGE